MAEKLVAANGTSNSDILKHVNVMAGTDIKIFKTKVKVNFATGGGKTVFQVYNEEMGKAAEPVTVGEIETQVKQMIKDLTGLDLTVNVNIEWPDGVKEIIDKTEVALNVVYLKYTKYSKTVESGQNDNSDKKDSLKYALWISVKAGKDILEKFPIIIESLYLKLWSDNVDSEIMKKMDLVDAEKLLGDDSANLIEA